MPFLAPASHAVGATASAMSITTDAWTSVSKAWLHGLAYLKANPGTVQQARGQSTHDLLAMSTYEQVVRHAHGSAGVWSQLLEASLHYLSIPVGEGMEGYFEYDPLRGCSKWNPFTCFPAPKFIDNLVSSIPSSSSPLLILEMRPFLGAASIALANALSYGKRDGFVLSVDTWRTNEGFVGIQQTNRAFPLPAVCANEGRLKGLCDDASYYQWARNVATGQVRGQVRGAWEPKQHQWENVTARLVPLPLLSSKARGTAHWLGSRGLRPSLVYLNAPTVGVDFKQELEQSWKILGCGGSIAGAGYRLPEVQSAVGEFAEKRKLPVEASFWRAAGTKYEQAWPWEATAEFQGRMEIFNKSNFSTWAIRSKLCKGEADAELPQVEAGAAVPDEFKLDE
jgi:hypothetical protein